MGGEEAGIRRIRGDGLSLKLGFNEQILEIAGDGCTISMAKNCGSVRILGDGCRLRIDQNLGNVEYTGDGGRVLLGPKSIKDNVRYIGDGGKVTFDDSKTKKTRSEQVPKKIDKKGTEEGFKDTRDKNRSSTVEEIQNAKNEAECDRRQKQDSRARTKFVTELCCDENLVSRWFVNPGSVIESYDGATFVKIAPGRTKTKVKANCE